MRWRRRAIPLHRAGRDGRLRGRRDVHGTRLSRPPRVARGDARRPPAPDATASTRCGLPKPPPHTACAPAGWPPNSMICVPAPRHRIALGRSTFRCPGLDVAPRCHHRRSRRRALPGLAGKPSATCTAASRSCWSPAIRSSAGGRSAPGALHHARRLLTRSSGIGKVLATSVVVRLMALAVPIADRRDRGSDRARR